ncbi:MAG: TonB-dependent receptor [Sphingobium sp.]|nr:TonB-dependent receptor [Sphingobium sp.]
MAGIRASRFVATSFAAISIASIAPAQENTIQPAPLAEPAPAATSGTAGDEIVITARRRDESSLAVPVAVTAVGTAQIERQNITSLSDLAKVVPGLKVGEVSGGVGGTIVLRGVGTTAGSNPSFEQTVSTNIDGIQLSRGSALRLGQIDMRTIEILKGPQALFFGKNSPAGVISVKTADPGDKLEVTARAGYEFNARETRADFVLSTPVTSTLGIRIALSASSMEGWRINDSGPAQAAANAIIPGAVSGYESRGPDKLFYFGRGTLKWQPTSDFDFRGKFTYSRDNGVGYQQSGGFQRIYCPNGMAFQANQAAALNGGVANAALASALAADNCKADNHYANGNINPNFLAGSPGLSNPAGVGNYLQIIGSGEINYRPSSAFTLTAISGYVRQTEFRYDTYGNAPSDAVAALDFYGRTRYTQLSQEIRLASTFDGPINFLVGAYIDDTKLTTNTVPLVNGAVFDHRIDGNAYSGFAQATWNILSDLELAGGARVTREKRELGIKRNGVPQPLSVTHATFDNLSPEGTLTYRPTQRLTFYGAYKRGFKSGGFATPVNGGPPIAAPGPNYLYKPEKVRGFEIGAKALLLDGTLRLNSAAYSYLYSDLQVNSLDNSTGAPVIRVTNAAAARVKGIEGDFVFRPREISDFDLHGALSYNHANYSDFLATCYIGQTIQMGCDQNPNAAGVFQGQQLAGHALVNAPRWNAGIGFNIERPLGSRLKIGVGSDGVYKSSYNPHPEAAPGARQKAVWFLDGSVHLFRDDRLWDVALVGRNLTNEYRVDVASNAGQTGIGARTGTSLAGGLADLNGNVNRGRELLLQFTIRPGVR